MAEEKNSVNELSDSLYSRTRYHDPKDSRAPIRDNSTESIKDTFNSPNLDAMIRTDRRKPEGHPVMKKLFSIALVFFVLALAAAAYIYFGGGNFISTKNVDIQVIGPSSISAGEVLELAITVTNENNADLIDTVLSVRYPNGTREAVDTTNDLSRIEEEIGTIEAGKEISRTMRAVLLGEKGDLKDIKITLEYNVAGSNATFKKEKTYQVSIGTIPVSMTADLPASVTSGQEFTATITIIPNGSEIIRNVVVRGEYPYGYNIVSSTPTPLRNNNLWLIGDIAPGDEKVIVLRGQLQGENSEERTFRFYTGVSNPLNPEEFDTTLMSVLETVAINRPSIGLAVSMNGDRSSTYVAPAGQNINGSISIENNMPEKLEDVRIEARLSGTALDEESISPQQDGFYRSQDKTITWDRSSNDSLGNLSPGDQGIFSFNFFSLKTLPPGESQVISVDVTVIGKLRGSGEEVRVTEKRLVKIASAVTLNSKVLYSRGPFKNTGPIPPKVETPTTYTITFTVGNTQNNVKDARVTGTLGANVTGIVKDASAAGLTYDESTKKVTWAIGTLASGAGFSSEAKEVSFQVTLNPSLGQLGGVPILVNNISFSGTDEFTNQSILVTNEALTTRMPSDPNFVQGDEQVVK